MSEDIQRDIQENTRGASKRSVLLALVAAGFAAYIFIAQNTML